MPNLELLVNQFNNATLDNNNDPKYISPSKYYYTEGMYNIEIPHKNKCLSRFHINACSIRSFDDHQHLLSCTKNNFDIIGVTVTSLFNESF